MPDTILTERCRRVAERLLKKNQWRLTSSEDAAFVAAIERRLQARVKVSTPSSGAALDKHIERAVQNAYCHVLYDAFQSEEAERRAGAIAEVQRHIYRGLLRMTDGDEQLSAECAQDAVTAIWSRLGTVRDPGTFLYFAWQTGIRKVIDWKRRNWRLADLPEDEEQEHDPALISLPGTPEAAAESKDWQDRLRRAVASCLRKPLEAQVILGLFLDDLSFRDLTIAWDIPPPRLSKIKFYALKKLERCKDIIDLWQSWNERT